MTVRSGPVWRLGIALCVVWALGARGSLEGQDDLSFSSAEISAGMSVPWITGVVGEHWRPRLGPRLSVATPYGPGVLRLSLEVSRLRAKRDLGVPDLLEVFPSVEWGGVLFLPRGAHASAGVGVGSLWMHAGDGPNPTEMEAAFTATLELRKAMGDAWSIGGGVVARRVLLSEPQNQTSLFVTVGRSVGVPPSVRALLDGAGDGQRVPAEGEGSTEAQAGIRLSPDQRRLAHGSRTMDLTELRHRGVLRLPEIVGALPDWERSTVDHRAFQLAMAGVPPFVEGAPSVWIDGIPVSIQLLGSTTMDRLPLGMESLGSVESLAMPGLFGGRFMDHGLLSLRTTLPRSDGVEVFGEVVAENPTGDPGPAVYTDSTADNVDKLGTGYTLGARWRTGPIGGSAGFRYSSDLVTDARLEGRTLSLRDPNLGYPVIRTRAPWASLRFLHGERGQHDLRAGRSTRTDYLFLPALGFEVPTESTFQHVGAAGTMATRSLQWTYRVHAGWNRLEGSPNVLDLDFDLATRSRGAQTSLGMDGESRSVWLGAGVDEEAAQSSLLPSPIRRTTARGFVSGSMGIGESRLGLDVELRRSRGATAGAWGFRGEAPLAGVTARWTVWDVRASGRGLDGFWALHEGGYRFLESAGVQVDVLSPVGPRRESGAQLELVGIPLGSSMEITPFARTTWLGGLALVRGAYVVKDRRPRPKGPLTLDGSASSGVVVAGVEGRWEPSSALRAEIRYRWMSAMTGKASIRDAWRSLPTHRVNQVLIWAPRSDLTLAFNAEGSSATRWVEFEGMGADRIPPSFVASLWMEKSLWEGRLSLYGHLRNLLDQHRPLHPLGAAPGLSLAAGGSARFGPSAEPGALRRFD